MKKLILLCDYGLDDAVATVYIFNSGKFDAVDIVPVGGNVPFKRAFQNAQKLTAHLDTTAAVRIIDTSALDQSEEYLPSIHGADGMGDCLSDKTCSVPLLSYADFLKTYQAENSVILSLGPLTVTKRLLQDGGAAELWIMGGNISEEPNFSGREFNHALDLDAFAYCTRFPHKIATLDSCRHPFFNAVQNKPKGDKLFNTLVDASVRLANARHPDRCYIYDYVAAYALLNPQSFSAVSKTDSDGNRLSVLTFKS